MNNEPNEANNQTKPAEQTVTEPVPKQLIDKPTDFRFHAAYLVYSEAWDRTTSQDTKQKLNDAITALSENKIDYETFYRQTSQYRAQLGPEQYSSSGRGRMYIETQRKKDWRKREERTSRNKRHGR